MANAELTEDLRQFLLASIPTFPAAELLLFLADNRTKARTAEEIVEAMRPTAITCAAVLEYARIFKDSGIISGDSAGGFRYNPLSPKLEANVEQLRAAYNERPVTLIRTIYDPSPNKIQSFADAFRLKKE